jgi:hypothetical protein
MIRKEEATSIVDESEENELERACTRLRVHYKCSQPGTSRHLSCSAIVTSEIHPDHEQQMKYSSLPTQIGEAAKFHSECDIDNAGSITARLDS